MNTLENNSVKFTIDNQGEEKYMRADLNNIPVPNALESIEEFSLRVRDEIVLIINEDNLDELNEISEGTLLLISSIIINAYKNINEIKDFIYEYELDQHSRNFEDEVGDNYSKDQYNKYLDKNMPKN